MITNKFLVEKLTYMRKENKLKNTNLVLDISEDLKTKSKKLRTEMEKFSRILETEISESNNNNNISRNITNSNFPKMQNYDNNLKTLSNFKKDNLKIQSSNENIKNNNNFSETKHFKKITYDPKSNKKHSFFKYSPNNAESKLQDKLMDLSKPKHFNNNNKSKTNNKSQLENKNNKKLFKEKPILDDYNKNQRMKDVRGNK